MDNGLVERINSIINKTKGNIVNENLLYKGNFISLYEEEYLLPNDRFIKREKIVKNVGKSSVIIIAITTDNKYILVFQNRINNITSIEFPGGYVEDSESAIDAAKRELLEEVGYVSNDIEIIDTYINSIGIDGSTINIVIASDCIKASDQRLGKYEFINYEEFSFDEVKSLIDSNYINSGGNRLAFYKYLYSKTTN